MARIRDIAKACKSKNAGPFELTLDVVFDERSMYERVRATGILGPKLFARLYKVRPGDPSGAVILVDAITGGIVSPGLTKP